jgi:hypothetical protein
MPRIAERFRPLDGDEAASLAAATQSTLDLVNSIRT